MLSILLKKIKERKQAIPSQSSEVLKVRQFEQRGVNTEVFKPVTNKHETRHRIFHIQYDTTLAYMG